MLASNTGENPVSRTGEMCNIRPGERSFVSREKKIQCHPLTCARAWPEAYKRNSIVSKACVSGIIGSGESLDIVAIIPVCEHYISI